MRTLILLFFSMLNLPLYGQGAAGVMETLRRGTDPKVLVAAHRGDWHNFPENSLPAIESVINMGADIVEIDVMATSDGELILMHDTRVDRTTNGKGKVSALTYEQIKQLRLKDHQGNLTTYRVPTLREALELSRGRIVVNIDKGYHHHRRIYDLLAETGTEGEVVVKTEVSHETVSADFACYPDPKIIFMPVVELRHNLKGTKKIISGFQDNMKVPAYEICFSKISPRIKRRMRRIKRDGSRIWVNTISPSMCGGLDDELAKVAPEKAYGTLLVLGVTIIQTDEPAYLLEFLRDQGLHD